MGLQNVVNAMVRCERQLHRPVPCRGAGSDAPIKKQDRYKRVAADCDSAFIFCMPPFATCKTMFSFRNSSSQPAKPCFHFKTARRNLRKPFSKPFGTFAALQNALLFSKHTFATRDSRCQNRLALAAPFTKKSPATARLLFHYIIYYKSSIALARTFESFSPSI